MNAGPIVNPTPTTPPYPPPVGQGRLDILSRAVVSSGAAQMSDYPWRNQRLHAGSTLRETWERLERTDGVLNFDWLDDSIDRL